jgi:hypothetical protein
MTHLDPRTDAMRWQPIETAPKDGTPFLGAEYLPHLASPFSNPAILPWARRVIWWDPQFEQVEWDYEQDEPVYRGAWCSGRVASWGGEEYAEEHPSHWMPLPPPPGEEA